MRNQKLKSLSKQVSENQVTTLSLDSVRMISGGTKSELELAGTCPGENGCWGFGAPTCGKVNECWSYNK
jgi:hypothetical protein